MPFLTTTASLGALAPWAQLGAVGLIGYLLWQRMKDDREERKIILNSQQEMNSAIVEQMRQQASDFKSSLIKVHERITDSTTRIDRRLDRIDRRIAAATGDPGDSGDTLDMSRIAEARRVAEG